MRKYGHVFILGLFPVLAKAQFEKVLLHWDKSICYPGDTAWLTGYVYGLKSISTNLYVELRDDSGKVLSSYEFLIGNHLSFGQVPLPDSPGNYWLHGYTRASQADDHPIQVKGVSNLILMRRVKPPAVDEADISLIGDTTGMIIQLPRGAEYSISVTKAPLTYNAELADQKVDSMADFGEPRDIDYLCFDGKVQSSYIEKGDKMALFVESDKGKLPMQLIPIDTGGHVRIAHLYFYDTAYFHYTFTAGGSHVKDFKSFDILKKARRPLIVPHYSVDTVTLDEEPLDTMRDKQYLPTAVVNGKIPWQERNKKLRHQYEPPTFPGILNSRGDWDVLHSADTGKGHMQLGEWLSRNAQPVIREASDGKLAFPGFYYIDGKEVTRDVFCYTEINGIAYVDFLEKPFPNDETTVNKLCAWTRKGPATRTQRDQMPFFAVKGYDRPLRWGGPDRITLLWVQYSKSEYFKLDNFKRPFTLTVVGMLKNAQRPFMMQTLCE